MIKRLKLSYAIYNFFHKDQLKHNVPLYKKLGLKKSYYSPVSSKDFKNIDPSILANIQYQEEEGQGDLIKGFEEITKDRIRSFNENGFLILKNYLSEKQADEVDKVIQNLLETKQVKLKYRNKIMFAIKKSDYLRQIGTDPELIRLLSALMNGDARLFQSINFIMGSEQRTHSDSIHMTTYPPGGLLGVWIALEDIDADNGPLHYYPGSHKLPYYLNSDYENEGSRFLLGDKDYTEYEKMLENKVKEHHIKKEVFTARKGDLLIWHANLLHGGEVHLNKAKTRKSMVFHYYDMNCICYHEITQRPSLIDNSHR